MTEGREYAAQEVWAEIQKQSEAVRGGSLRVRFNGHGKELGKQTNGKELEVILGMVLPRGCYKEVGQTRWVLRMLDANQSEQKDSLIQLLKEQFVSGYVQLRRRKCLEVCTYSQPNCLCPGGV